MRRNRFIVGLMLLLGFVGLVRLWVQFGQPLFLRAQTPPPVVLTGGPDNVGPHAGFFDVGNNVGIVNMVKTNAKGKNLPITVMMDINISVEEAKTILGSVQGLKPMIRVVGIRFNTENSEFTDLANVLADPGVQALMPSGTLVVLGNELNNLDHEYGVCPESGLEDGGCPDKLITAGQRYGEQFREFIKNPASNYVAVPAPPDMYNGNYGWSEFVMNAGVYGNGQQLVANVYKTGVPDRAENAGKIEDPLTLYQKLGNVVAFTEYGPDPGTATLQEHIDFFAQTPAPVPATTLIPDRCTSSNFRDDLWLYYIDGAIYTKDGTPIDPANCSTASNAEPPDGTYYQRFIYPFYPSQLQDNQLIQQEIENKLIADYRASCVAPAEYETFVGNIAEIFNVFNANYRGRVCIEGLPSEACLFTPEASLVLSSNGSQTMFGVLRDELAVRWRAYERSQAGNESKRSFTNRFESIEQWFGANNPEESEYLGTPPEEIKETHQGPYYKLAGAEMQCQAAAQIMKATYALCEDWKIQNPQLVAEGKFCPLDKPIAGTSYSLGTLSQAMVDEVGNSNPTLHPAQILCNEYYTPSTDTKNYKYKPLIDALHKVDLYMETAYRPAFLVMVTEVDNPEPETNASNPQAKIIKKDGESQPLTKHIVDYLVYHVPSTLTDISKNSTYYHKDVVTQTIERFTPQSEIQKRDNDAAALRDRVSAGVAEVKTPGAVLSPPVECSSFECPPGEPLKLALVNFINGSGTVLGEELKCDTGVANNEDRVEVGKSIGSRLGPIDETNPAMQKASGSAEVRIFQYYDKNGVAVYTKTVPMKTKIYNIAPFGSNTDFAGRNIDTLFSAAQQKQFSQKEGYYSTFGAEFEDTFTTKEDTANGYMVENDDGVTGKVDVGGGIKLQNEGTAFSAQFKRMGKLFNHSTRAVTQLVVGWGSKTWNCATQVANGETNTEDFLKNCQNGSGSSGSSSGDSGTGGQCVYTGQKTVLPADAQELRNKFCAAADKYRVPGFMLKSILAIEGGDANNSYGGEVQCKISSTGDVGPMQINVPECRPGGSGSVQDRALCSFDGGIEAAAALLYQKALIAKQLYGVEVPNSQADWSYELAYRAGGLYNGNPGCNANPGTGPDLQGGEVDGNTSVTYCKFAAEAFDGNAQWRCDNDPAPWNPATVYPR